MSATERWGEYEEKLDELNEGLLKAYAAGFAKGAETFGPESACTDYRELMKDNRVRESHYYFWDGRVKPLNQWLRKQFGVDGGYGQNADREDHSEGRDWKCDNCGYRPRLVHVDEPVDSCSFCGSDEWSVDTGSEQSGGDA